MTQLFRKTDKHIIPTLPRFTFPGRIVVISRQGEAERAVRALERQKLLGIDTETKPTFRRGAMHKVALLQVSTRNTCFLFRLNVLGFTSDLQRLLASTQVVKVGLSLRDDFHMLRLRHDFTPGAYVDLQDTVREMGIEDMSLQKIFANVFRRRISKSAQLTNWEAPLLSDSQKLYAATDAYACLVLYDELRQLQESGDYEIIDAPAPEPQHDNTPSGSAR